MKKLSIFLLFLFSFLTFAKPEIPALTGTVVDAKNKLSDQVKNEINTKIRSVYQEGKGPQLAVLIVERIPKGSSLEYFTNDVFNAWALGDRAKDDGVLLLIALDDRLMRIEVGRGLEGSLTDYQSKQITSGVIKPLFKKGKIDDGVLAGVEAILAEIGKADAVQMPAGVTKDTPISVTQAPSESQRSIDLGGLFFVVLVIGFVVWTGVEVNRYFQVRSLCSEAAKSVKELVAKYGKPVAEVNKTLEEEHSELEKKTGILANQLAKEKQASQSSPLTKKRYLEEEKYAVESNVRSLENTINDYKETVRRGK